MGPRTSSRRPSSGPSLGGTPDSARSIPTHADLKSLMATDSGPIKLVQDVRKWLETKGWILAAEPYDRSKLVSILVTAAIASRLEDLKRAAIAVAFILESDVTDHVSDTLANAVASKTIHHLGGLIEKLGSLVDFITANDATHANSTLELKATSDGLEGIFSSLNAVASKLASPPPPPSVGTPITWVLIASAATPRPSPVGPSPQIPPSQSLLALDITQIQQRALRDARTVLIQHDPNDPTAPKDLTAMGTSKLHDDLNKLLAQLDKKVANIGETKDGKLIGTAPRTQAIGLKTISGSAYLAEFESADSASRFCCYMVEEWHLFDTIFGECMEVIDKAYNLIMRFVPCTGDKPPLRLGADGYSISASM
ncbi:hypothetical protein C0992_006930 [Termitomyces sp. T32_za158]|nr:hypothetical protein C0992_006930 [Termitomyces sp. T32_za158]